MNWHKLINLSLTAVSLACIAWAGVQCERLNQPGAATLFSVPALLNFWSLAFAVPAIWACRGLHGFFSGLPSYQPAIATVSDLESLKQSVIASFRREASKLALAGRYDELNTMKDCEKTLLGMFKA